MSTGRFTLVSIRRITGPSNEVTYQSLIQQGGLGSAVAHHKEFKSFEEIQDIHSIFRGKGVRELLEASGSYQRRDVDLTDEQAKALGWKG